jgi:uncharacterized protein YcbK (DUF882 family)
VRDFKPNFSLRELTHSDKAVERKLNNVPFGTTLARLNNLSWALQRARENLAIALGRVVALGINSAYRSPAVNAAVGGARFSRHLNGDAADISIKGWPADHVRALIVACIKAGFGGIGLGTNKAGVATFLHVDLRTVPTVWLYNGGRVGQWRGILGPDPVARGRSMLAQGS